MVTLYDFKVNVETDIDDEYDDPYTPHDSIIIETPAAYDVPTNVTMTEAVTAYRWTSGITGRLAVSFLSEIQAAKDQHRCPVDRTQCGISGGDDIAILQANKKLEPPWLSFTIPRGQAKAWDKKIRNRLAEILTADRWQPTAADERTWINPHAEDSAP